MQAEPQIETYGRHLLWIEEPDTVFMDLDGDITSENILDFLAPVARLGEAGRPVILVQDLSKVGSFTAGARKAITDDLRSSHIKLVISVGASFQLRVVLSMINKTARMLNRELAETVFAKDLAEARAMLPAERARLAANVK